MAAVYGPNVDVNVFWSNEFAPHGGFSAEDELLLLRSQGASVTPQWIDQIILRRGMVLVKVIAGRKNSAIPLPRGLRQRSLPAPRLDDDIFWSFRLQNFVPTLHDFVVACNEFLHSGGEIRL